MKRWKKIALLLLLLLLLSQTPFIYRRYKLGRLAGMIQTLNAERVSTDASDPYSDYKGVVHVHSLLGGHSTGGFDDIVKAARANGLAFVLMTEHPSKHVDTVEATLKGIHEGVLFVNGSEISAAGEDRLLVLPGVAPPRSDSSTPLNTQNVVAQAKEGGRLVFVAYPEQLRSWDLNGLDGIEIYNLYTNSKKIRYGLLFFDGLWSYWSYPHLLFSTFYEKPTGNLKKWDELTASGNRRLVALAGNDAHQNVGISLQEQTGEPLMQIQLDPYARSFQVVRTHVLTEKGQPLSQETLLRALSEGHCYIAFDLFADATGFRFTAENNSEKRLMGDELALDGATRLIAAAPVKSRIVFIRDGQIVHEEKETLRKELAIDRKGVYRVEVYLDRLGQPLDAKPWIISNPIYVR